jgi:hypothetical protein
MYKKLFGIYFFKASSLSLEKISKFQLKNHVTKLETFFLLSYKISHNSTGFSNLKILLFST